MSGKWEEWRLKVTNGLRDICDTAEVPGRWPKVHAVLSSLEPALHRVLKHIDVSVSSSEVQSITEPAIFPPVVAAELPDLAWDEVAARNIAASVFYAYFNDQELATVLAALRYWQNRVSDVELAKTTSPDHFRYVAPLSAVEIDVLCERINEGVTDTRGN